MGCCESSQEPRDTFYIARVSEYSYAPARREDNPYYGNFKCHSCNRHWTSRFSWPDKYQVCKGCRSRVYPYKHRELKTDDFDGKSDESKEHQMNLCQKCQERGELCIKNKNLPRRKHFV